MQIQLADFLRNTPEGEDAERILGNCVHCGFCTATCPTYQVVHDELDGPRGRIYLIKQAVEGVPVTRKTQYHLDRCLTCRSCETTCPSGVEYGRLLEIGRQVVDAQVPRPAREKWVRKALRDVVPEPARFAPMMALAQMCRPALPAVLRDKIPARRVPVHESMQAPSRTAAPLPEKRHARRMLMLDGCVQPTMRPTINPATARVMDAIGVSVERPGKAGCCGALRLHLGDIEAARADARRNIDAWWPAIEAGAEALIINASGCGATVKEYDHLLRGDAAYAEKAKRVVELSADLSEIVAREQVTLAEILAKRSTPTNALNVAYHPPCTLQHGQQVRGFAETLLRAAGMTVTLPADSHLCCGSAGTYSILQKDMATTLRERKITAIEQRNPDVIATANIGCITHLQAGTRTPVVHWIELLDHALAR